jgi:dienelactone hydrolase
VTEAFQSVDTTKSIQYGSNTTYGGNAQDLFMDVYEPVGDQATERPVILLAFGGSFISGTRQDIEDLCVDYAKRGFVAVTIDYRLYDGPLFPFPSATTMTDVVVKAAGDMKAAVRYLKEDAATNNIFKIDTNLIFVGGISSGAIVANHLTYLDSTDVLTADVSTAVNTNGGWPGNSSTNFQYSSTVAGVINFSGAILDTNYLSPGDVPIFSVHDDSDGTVPYGTGSVTLVGVPIITMSGSGAIHVAANTNSISNHLITVPNSTGHVSYMDNGVWQDSVVSESAQFLNDIICFNPLNNGFTINSPEINIYPNPSDGVVKIDLWDSDIVTIEIIDLKGRIVASYPNYQNNSEISIVRSGVYFVKVISGTIISYEKLIIK